MRRRGFLKRLGVVGSAVASSRLLAPTARAAARNNNAAAALARLKHWPASVQARIARYDGGRLIKEARVALDAGAVAHADLDGAIWTCALRAQPVKAAADAVDLLVTFRLTKGTCTGANVGVALELGGWARSDYLLLPGAVYDGNRFESRHIAYPPLLTEPADIGPNVPPIISDIPRLDIHGGSSRIDLLAGDVTTPAIGVWSARQGAALWLLTDQTTPFGDVGITVAESDVPSAADAGDGAGGDDQGRATLLITAPGVRENHRYALGNTRAPSHDQAAAFTAGSELVLRLRLYQFRCPERQGLFDRFVTARKDLSGPTRLRHTLPFSSAAQLHEEKYNRDNWMEKPGLYATTSGERAGLMWQTGWGGGLIATHPLLFGGDPRTRERVTRTFDFVFAGGGQARSGFFHAASDGKIWVDEGAVAAARAGAPQLYKHARGWHLVRRSGDALYFMLKQLALLERQDQEFKAKESWTAGLQACADAFVTLWDRYRQLGQFVNVETGQLVVGGSTAGAIVPAALALAARTFKNDDYQRVAVAAAEAYHQRVVHAGVTNGGAPDALQCPDSESAAALLESFIALFEMTGERVWLDRAAAVAHQLATWQISYDFRFPAASTFARADIQTTGAVVGNAQNKHAAPGFLLYSGDALLKLYRATGKPLYLELLRDTAHNVTQYLNRQDHRLHAASEPGTTCARVNTSDAADTVGETAPQASSPAEICGMLTAAEVPGLYVQPDTGFVFAFDHVDARIKEKTRSRLVVTLDNPTPFEAAVRVLAENSAEREKPLGLNALWGGRVETVPAGGSFDLELARGSV
jgi:hypothetical protein